MGSRYIDWLVPGLLGMNIMSTGLWGLGFSIVTATRKLLKRLVASPMSRRDYLLAQFSGASSSSRSRSAVLVGFSRIAFGVPMHGAWVTIAHHRRWAQLLGARAAGREPRENGRGPSGLLNLVMLPMWLLSGVFFASSNFPDPLQPFIRVLPLTALNDALRAVMLEGATASGVTVPLVLLGAWGAASYGLALRLFRWM